MFTTRTTPATTPFAGDGVGHHGAPTPKPKPKPKAIEEVKSGLRHMAAGKESVLVSASFRS